MVASCRDMFGPGQISLVGNNSGPTTHSFATGSVSGGNEVACFT
jgi:hypothetical protein